MNRRSSPRRPRAPSLPASLFAALGAIVAASACAARKVESEPKSAASEPPPAQAYPAQSQPGYAAPEAAKKTDSAGGLPGVPPPPPPAPQGSGAPATDDAAAPPNRSVALRKATTDLEAGQRELDVAGGDCRNACRALQSMDRAAGRLCGLAQSDDEVRRCGDAKSRVYTARDKVRNTCGQCSEVSVDRNAPIPSAR